MVCQQRLQRSLKRQLRPGKERIWITFAPPPDHLRQAGHGFGPLRRDGASDPNMTGPLGTTLALRLADPATGIVLNTWVDADRTPQGDAPALIDD